MSKAKSQFDLFGLDLSAVGRYFLDGWAEAATWPIVRWISPGSPVRVVDPSGEVSVRLGVSAAPVKFKGSVVRNAIELPEDLVLRRTLVLPRLNSIDLETAVALDARSASPFAESDLVWGFDRSDGPDDTVRINSVISSRALIERYVSDLDIEGSLSRFEVWAGGDSPIVIRGYGESGRNSAGSQSRWVTAGLFALGVCLLVALAVTPFLQLRYRAIDAIYQYGVLQEKTKSQVNLRSDLIRFNSYLERLGDVVSGYVDPLVTIEELSQLLPDDVVISSLEFKGNVVRVSGQASNAARLLDLLTSQPSYLDVKAPAATTRAPGGGREYFTFEFKIKRTEKK